MSPDTRNKKRNKPVFKAQAAILLGKHSSASQWYPLLLKSEAAIPLPPFQLLLHYNRPKWQNTHPEGLVELLAVLQLGAVVDLHRPPGVSAHVKPNIIYRRPQHKGKRDSSREWKRRGFHVIKSTRNVWLYAFAQCEAAHLETPASTKHKALTG